MPSSPDTLSGKKILLGISGGIAAYKIPLLIREMKKRGAEVRVVATQSALQFVTKLTLETVSGNSVVTSIFPDDTTSQPGTWHINLALWADLFLIAPATMNSIAKFRAGLADDALSSLFLAKRCKTIICPSADEDMYSNPISQDNIQNLRKLGNYILEAEKGSLASGLEGIGRLPEITKILDSVNTVLSGYTTDLSGRRILVTAGPTFEDIDPVRFIGNRSSGKMGANIAKAAHLRGAEVTLIGGPVSFDIYPEIKFIGVRSAIEMQNAIKNTVADCDILIMSAAVADYRPLIRSDKKIKKSENDLNLVLTENPDILKEISDSKITKVGFALETDNEIVNAKQKLLTKNLDFIILNSMNDEGAGFEYDTNKVSIFSKEKVVELPLLTKFQTAHKILDIIFS